MKKIMMIAAIAAAALTSCSQSETVDLSTGNAIGFETYVGKATTRGVPVNTFAEGATMKVWGYYGTTSPATNFASVEAALPNLGGTEVTKGATGWSYSPSAYWKDAKAHSFIACSPYITDASLTYTGGKFTYTVKATVDEQVDFMVADPVKKTTWDGNNVDPIVFKFRHALSQIKYTAKMTEGVETSVATDITITSIKIEALANGDDNTTANLFTAGVIDAFGKSGEGDVTYEGSHTGEVASYTVTPGTQVALTNGMAEFLPVNHGTDNQILMLMPQTTVGNVRFTIDFAYKDGKGVAQTANATFITKTAQTWAPNKIYTYKFEINMPQVLNQKPIVIGDATIESWDSTPNDNTLNNNPATN